MPFTKTEEFPSHGSPRSSPDITGGFGYRGVANLRDLSAIDASTVFDGDDAFVFRGQKPFGLSNQGEVYFEKVNAPGSTNDRTYVYLDTDGDRAPEMVIELTGLHKLTAGDFIL